MPEIRETLAALEAAEASLQTQGPLAALAVFNRAIDIRHEFHSPGHFHTYVSYCARAERWAPHVNRVLGRILVRSLESYETANAEVKLAYCSAFNETCEEISYLDYLCWEYENVQVLDSEGENIWDEVGVRLKENTDEFYMSIRRFARARFLNFKVSAIALDADDPEKLAEALEGELLHYIRAHRDENLTWLTSLLGRLLSTEERKIIKLLEDDVVCQVLVHNGLLESCQAELRLQYEGGSLTTYSGIRSILYATRALAVPDERASNGGPSILDRFKSICSFVVQEAVESLYRFRTQYIGMSTTRGDNGRNVWHLLAVLAAFPSLRQALITSGIVPCLVRYLSDTIAAYLGDLEYGRGHHAPVDAHLEMLGCALVIIWFLHLDFDEETIQILLNSFAQIFMLDDKEMALTDRSEKGFSKLSRLEKWLGQLKLIWSLLVDLQRAEGSVLRDWPERILRHLIDSNNIRVVFFMIAHIPDQQNDELLIRWWSTFFDTIETWLYDGSATKDEPRGSLARILARCNLNQQNQDNICTIVEIFIHNQDPRSAGYPLERNRLREFHPLFFDSRLNLVSLGGIETILDFSLQFSEVALALIRAGRTPISMTWTEWMQTTLDDCDDSLIENERLLHKMHMVIKKCNPPIAFASLKIFPVPQGGTATNSSAHPESSNYVRGYLNMIACLTVVIYACRKSLPSETFRLLATHLSAD